MNDVIADVLDNILIGVEAAALRMLQTEGLEDSAENLLDFVSSERAKLKN